ncbi:CHY zinc finger protein [Pseudogracilibacillus sp. SE30717A]|uniref:CHY zinc finger protein n=1 Tax=Pseudogracilibacillus sp. SE30717A TaxID=3098293 RepID=UPI00300DC005
MQINGHRVRGNVIDLETRCTHYHSEKDRIAIKFFCCNTYYPCYSCHEEKGCGNHQTWPANQFDQKAILCGACGEEITIKAYLNKSHICPYCKAEFNPGCSLHYHLYFSVF